MKNRKLIAAIAVFALLALIKFAFPGVGALIGEKAAQIFRYDIYRDRVIEAMKSTFGAGDEDGAETVEPAYAPVRAAAETALPAGTPPQAAESGFSYQEGSCEGETPPVFYPQSVTAFLRAQEEFSDYALPEDISYDYQPLPFDYCVPVSGGKSSGFGYRLHPIQNVVKFHYGTDIAAWTGEDVAAFADGQVLTAEYSESYGNYIVISHSDGWQSLYAHCSKLLVKAGDSVEEGEVIAKVGATGHVTGPHLHFELSHDGLRCNPEYYINDP